MDRLRELVRLHRQGRGTREIARLLGMSPNTERKYRDIFTKAGVLQGDPDALPSLKELREVIPQAALPKHECSSIETWTPQVRELIKGGQGPTGIHEILDQFDDFTGSLSSVKRLYSVLTAARGPRPEDVAIPVITEAGHVAQVDFGYIGKLVDPATDTLRKAWVFVMVLGCSRHMFAKAVFDQTIATWLQLHVDAFAFFGGVVEVVVPDNLKSAVIRAAFAADEMSVLNRSYRELARHYGFIIDPAPPRQPEKKGKVERSIRYVKGSFYSRRTFTDIGDSNRQLHEWTLHKAGMRTHGTTQQRPIEAFETVEKSALKPLPAKPFALVTWKKGKVNDSSHLSFEKAFWSAPWTLIGKEALVRATPTEVEIHIDNAQVAVHARYPHQLWHTIESHLPEGRRDLRHRSRSHWEARADELGDEVGAYIRAVFDVDKVQRPLRRVASMLRALEAVPVDRAQATCRRAAYFGNYTANGIKAILRKGLDAEPLPGTGISPTWATTPQYARSAEAFLATLTEEDSHGCC